MKGPIVSWDVGGGGVHYFVKHIIVQRILLLGFEDTA